MVYAAHGVGHGGSYNFLVTTCQNVPSEPNDTMISSKAEKSIGSIKLYPEGIR
jgi:hypothetical protein